MVAWWWIPVFFSIGAVIGAILMAVCASNNARVDRRKWWEDE